MRLRATSTREHEVTVDRPGNPDMKGSSEPDNNSLCDFDAGPPLKSGSSVSIQFREILNGGIVWTYWFFSPLSL